MYFSAIINKLKTFFSPKKLHVLSMPAYMNLHSSLDLDSNVRGLLPHQIPFEIGFYGQIESSDCISMANAKGVCF